jgi:hypothetical protein
VKWEEQMAEQEGFPYISQDRRNMLEARHSAVECITSTLSQQIEAKSDPGTKRADESLRCTC